MNGRAQSELQSVLGELREVARAQDAHGIVAYIDGYLQGRALELARAPLLERYRLLCALFDAALDVRDRDRARDLNAELDQVAAELSRIDALERQRCGDFRAPAGQCEKN